MPLQNASIFDVRALPPEQAKQQYGLRILVMRRWPRGVKHSSIDLWIPDAGPSQALLHSYNAKEIDWEQFSAAYRKEQEETKGGW
jgi:uncharacterized protein YeaO (DUF488 family)